MKSDYIQKELAKYNLPDAKIAEMGVQYLPLKVRDADDMEAYLVCKEAHQKTQKLRIAIEEKRKELKSSSLEFGRAVDGEAKRLTCGVRKIEDHLYSQRKVVEDEKKRIKEEKERKEREEQERLRCEEEARLEAQRKKQEEEGAKLREAQEKLDEERRSLEEEKAKAVEEKKRAAELKKANKEAAERAVEAEKEAREKEEAKELALREAQRRKELKPDVEKIKDLAEAIGSFEFPEVADGEAKVVVETAKRKMSEIVTFLRKAKI